MHAWEQIQITIDYIENNLDKDLSITLLSDLASLSPFYYQRLFHRLVEKPVKEYIRLRRLAIASKMLLESNRRIIDIAIDLGFETHEHFTHVFKSSYGMSPSEYRKNHPSLNVMNKPNLLLNYVLIDEGVPLITEDIVLEVNRKEVNEDVTYSGFTKKLALQYGASLGIDPGIDILDSLWNDAHSYKEKNKSKVISEEEIGVMLPCQEKGFYNYFSGLHLNDDSIDEWILTKGKYIVCTFEGEDFNALVNDALYKAQRYMFSVWLPTHHIKIKPFCVEYYSEHNEKTTKMELLMKIKE